MIASVAVHTNCTVDPEHTAVLIGVRLKAIKTIYACSKCVRYSTSKCKSSLKQVGTLTRVYFLTDSEGRGGGGEFFANRNTKTRINRCVIYTNMSGVPTSA